MTLQMTIKLRRWKMNVSSKRDLLVLESLKTQEVIYQRGEKSVAVCFSETDGDIKVKLRF